ncbi:MAG: cytochrome d ubiquinol oxidase subunit II [Deltaproteobacteria bacterium]|nr:cytochrome d ubiquinol oxidase subunit II [Deltaproteobacteria bacterium]
MTTLQIIWFVLVGFLFVMYSVLDGFDLGVGFWSLFISSDKEKRILLNSVGPVWDGNEVWLLAGGGALFAAFPHVYATVFSGFYLALMLVLYALIFRAVSLEFRSKLESNSWRSKWDLAFGLSGALPALLFGVALGNILRGLPLDASMNFTGNFFTLLNPYALLIGVLGFSMIVTHGAVWIMLKAGGDLAVKAARWARLSWTIFATLFVVVSIVTLVWFPRRTVNFRNLPVLWLIPLFAAVSIGLAGFYIKKAKAGSAFLWSALAIASMWGITGASLFPLIVPALEDPAKSLSIVNSSSSELTLTAMLVMALIGVPIVLLYTLWAYRVFWGKVDPGQKVY